jgi:uncharacterized protein with ATP-grasp and redox domains
MRTYLECYSCLVRQTFSASQYAGADEPTQRHVMNRVLGALQELNPYSTPPETADLIHRLIRQETGNPDPYRQLKEKSNRDALELLPWMEELVRSSPDPFETAVRLAIAGNIIDFAPNDTYDLRKSVENVLSRPLYKNDVAALQAALQGANWVLYMADNAGETVFDRLLLEQIYPKPVRYCVKPGPAMNDALLEDALAAGIDRYAEIISTGYDAVGVIFERASPEFLDTYAAAPLIIAKGMANYETLSEQGSRLFFLVQAKCSVIAEDMHAPLGSLIAARGT